MTFPDEAAPGACTGLLDDGKETYGSYGVRSVEDPGAVTPDTLFRVASISKVVTATALTRLGVDLSSPVRDHLPGFRVAEDGVGERVTVRDLVTHRGGWEPDHAAYRPADELDAEALTRAVADMASARQIFPLGRFYGYSDAGFTVLARVVEVAAGEPYEHAVRRLVFEPAGMTRSTFFTDEAVTYPIALGHTGSPPEVIRPWGRSRARNGAGGLMTTARDLIAFARHLLAAPQPMWQPLADAEVPGHRVAVAWNVHDLPDGTRTVGHGGLTRGYSSLLTLVPESRRAFVIVANSDQTGGALDRAAADALDLPRGAAHAYVAAPDVRDQLGVYSDGDGETRVDGVGDGVMLSGGRSARVRFTGPDEGVDENGTPVRFLRDGGEVRWMRVGFRVLRRTDVAAP